MDITYTNYLLELGCLLSGQAPDDVLKASQVPRDAVNQAVNYWASKDFVRVPCPTKGQGAYRNSMFCDTDTLADFIFTTISYCSGDFPSFDDLSPSWLKLSYIAASSAITCTSVMGEFTLPTWRELCEVSGMYRNGIIPYSLYREGAKNFEKQYNQNSLIIGNGNLNDMKRFIGQLSGYFRMSYGPEDIAGTIAQLWDQYSHEREHYLNVRRAYTMIGLPYKPLIGLEFEDLKGTFHFEVNVSPFENEMLAGNITEEQYWQFYKIALKPAIEQSQGDEFLAENVFKVEGSAKQALNAAKD